MDHEGDKTSGRRFRFRFTLGAMMALVLLIGMGLGWIVHRARVQRVAMAEVRKAGGRVYYDWQFTDGRLVKNNTPRGPKRLREALGPDLFETVTNANFIGPMDSPPVLTDATMAALGRLDHIRGISIHGTTVGVTKDGFASLRSLHGLEAIIHQGRGDSTGFLANLDCHPGLKQICLPRAVATDADMDRIGKLTGLKMLVLNGRGVTDAGFSRVASLEGLKTLNLSECEVSDLSPIRDLTNLEELDLGGFRRKRPSPRASGVRLGKLAKLKDLTLGGIAIGDEELGQLAGLGNLRTLQVEGTGITQAGLASLANLPKLRDLTLIRTSIRDISPLNPALSTLRSLDLTESPVTDGGLAKLEGLQALADLHLAGTQITDAGTTHLAGLVSLRWLNLSNTKITDAALLSMPKLPACETINVYGTAITDAGILQFKKTSPRTRVVREPPEPLE